MRVNLYIAMKQKGIVVEINGKNAKVECDRASACDMCENSASCTEKCKNVYANAENSICAKIGDCVEIESDTSRVLKNAFFVFILPILLAVISYFCTHKFVGEVVAVIVTLAVLVFSLCLFSFLLNKSESKKNVSRIVKIL